MRLTKRPIAACVLLAGLAFAAGCGGGESSENGTPTASIGGPKSEGAEAQTVPAGDPSQPKRPAADPDFPRVLIETSLGEITVRLNAREAPLTVANFLRYVDSGSYDGTIFHQVIKEYPKLVIGGAYTADLSERPTRTPVRNEAHNGLRNRRGTLAMARRPDAIDSATCHFFINVTDNKVLDHQDRTLEGYGYCVFGEVENGMDVVDRIAQSEVHDTEQFERIPVEPVTIHAIRELR